MELKRLIIMDLDCSWLVARAFIYLCNIENGLNWCPSSVPPLLSSQYILPSSHPNPAQGQSITDVLCIPLLEYGRKTKKSRIHSNSIWCDAVTRSSPARALLNWREGRGVTIGDIAGMIGISISVGIFFFFSPPNTLSLNSYLSLFTLSCLLYLVSFLVCCSSVRREPMIMREKGQGHPLLLRREYSPLSPHLSAKLPSVPSTPTACTQ